MPLGPGPALTPGRPRRLSIDVLPLAVESGQTYNVDPKSGRILVMRTIERTPGDAAGALHAERVRRRPAG